MIKTICTVIAFAAAATLPGMANAQAAAANTLAAMQAKADETFVPMAKAPAPAKNIRRETTTFSMIRPPPVLIKMTASDNRHNTTIA